VTTRQKEEEEEGEGEVEAKKRNTDNEKQPTRKTEKRSPRLCFRCTRSGINVIGSSSSSYIN
jgi:hypothetical protein